MVLLVRLEGVRPSPRPVVLKKYVVANRVDECAQTVSVMQATLGLQGCQYPGEGLLAQIFGHFARINPRTQLELDQFAEIRRKMLQRRGIRSAEPRRIRRVKRLELQAVASSPRVSTRPCYTHID